MRWPFFCCRKVEDDEKYHSLVEVELTDIIGRQQFAQLKGMLKIVNQRVTQTFLTHYDYSQKLEESERDGYSFHGILDEIQRLIQSLEQKTGRKFRPALQVISQLRDDYKDFDKLTYKQMLESNRDQKGRVLAEAIQKNNAILYQFFNPGQESKPSPSIS